MAWNEPDRDKKKDPWGGAEQGGPPTLDDLFGKLKRRKKSNGGASDAGNDEPGGSSFFVIAVLVLAGLWLLYDSISIVDEGEVGVLLRFGEYETTLEPGLNFHFPRPVDRVEIVDIARVRSITSESQMLTQDENIVNVSMGVQYRVSDPLAFLFNTANPEETLAAAAESALRAVVGNSTMDFVLSEGRAEVASRTRDLIQQILQSYQTGLDVMLVNLTNVRPPEEVRDAFDDVIEAREDRERFINEAQAYANSILPQARGQAASVIEAARAYRAGEVARAQGDTARFGLLLDEYEQAPDVTRERLYLETMEEVMGNVSTVLMGVDEGNSLFYLPLQEMLRQRNIQPSNNQPDANDYGVTTVTPPEAYPREADRSRNGGRP